MRLSVYIHRVIVCALICGGTMVSSVMAQENTQTKSSEEGTTSQSYRNMNIDMQLVYGQYNQMLSVVNLSQEQQNFVYLLQSNFEKSNDYGYNKKIFQNTSYYKSKIGFIGNITFSENWKSLFEANVRNVSYGMASNPTYSREEKDNIDIEWKNIVKSSPSFEVFYTLGGSQYYHRLHGNGTTSSSVRSRIYHGHASLGGEYIWSASNRFKYTVSAAGYSYPNYKDDFFCNNEIIDDFNITRYAGFSIGINIDYNMDDGWLAGPVLGINYKGINNLNVALEYRYVMQPFKPEDLFLEQKFVKPVYDLDPARVHSGVCKVDYRLNRILTTQMISKVQHSNYFYNYITTDGDVLSAHGIHAWVFNNSIKLNIRIIPMLIDFNLQYSYQTFRADEHITYRPVHTVTVESLYNGEKWKFNITHDIASSVYISPESGKKLSKHIIGNIDVQRKMLEGFFAYIRVENVYNNRYYLRENYPESGIKGLFGIRILL